MSCVVIEDSPTGIRAGKAAGMIVIGVCHSFGPERLYEADLVIPHIRDLLTA
jgi:sugar-phosphatase